MNAIRKIVDGYDTPFVQLSPPPADEAGDTEINPRNLVLSAGTQFTRGARKLACDIAVERDVAIPLRDGVVLRGDIYRPVQSSKDAPLPTVFAFTPYGKEGGYWQLGLFPGRAGVSKSRLSGLQTFESPDPNDWVPNGYAVVVVDTRGSYHSDGDMHWWGRQGAEDGYDVIEWIAAQPWSNGRVGMTGNSNLAIIQWAIAAARPPHLTAIAPWEGLVDFYQDNLVAGGIPFPEFTLDVQNHYHGRGLVEDISSMLEPHPFYDDYWAGKAAVIEDIEVPAYVGASITNSLHTRGTLDGYRRLKSDKKWLRIHNTMEWPDYYNIDYVRDLRLFFDHFLKGDENGWENTSRVRYSVLNLDGVDIVDRAATAWPPVEVQHVAFHLDAAHKALSTTPSTLESTVEYDSTDVNAGTSFTYTFPSAVELVGYGSLRLWVSALDANDFDVFVEVEKADGRGRAYSRVIFDVPQTMKKIMTFAYRRGIVKEAGFAFWRGPGGRIRASRRELDSSASTPSEPRLAQRSDQPIEPGELIPVDIALWPTSTSWKAGDTLRLTIRGQDPRKAWFPKVAPVSTINAGTHRLATGGDHASILLLPVINGA